MAIKHRSETAPASDHEGDIPTPDWDAAVIAHNHRVLLSLLAIGVPIELAQDLANQAWMKLIEQHRAGKLRELKLPGLAIRQARFLALNELKQRETNRRRSIPMDDLWSSPRAREPDVEVMLLAREKLERALASLDDCSKTARTVFCYAYEDPPPSHKVIAQRVGLSVQRVRQILCELRKTMREAMEDDQ